MIRSIFSSLLLICALLTSYIATAQTNVLSYHPEQWWDTSAKLEVRYLGNNFYEIRGPSHDRWSEGKALPLGIFSILTDAWAADHLYEKQDVDAKFKGLTDHLTAIEIGLADKYATSEDMQALLDDVKAEI